MDPQALNDPEVSESSDGVSDPAGDAKGLMRAVARAASATCMGLAPPLMIWAVALGLWSRFGASRTVYVGSWNSYGLLEFGNQTPGWIAVNAAVVAAILTYIMVQTLVFRLRGTVDGGSVGLLILGGVIGAVYLGGRARGLAGFSRDAGQNFPHAAQLPTAIAAWWLACGGAVALAAGARQWINAAHPPRSFVTAGLVISVAVSVVCTGVALRTGDDRRLVDATTAAEVAVPPVPQALGVLRFHLHISDQTSREAVRQADYQVAPAGAGFVVLSRDGVVTAYGGDGRERWHYRRTGPSTVSVHGMVAFDQGTTVLLDLAGDHSSGLDGFATLVGLDAVTGRQLWSATDHVLYGGYDPNTRNPDWANHFLIAQDKDSKTWTRFDARTGKALWTIPSPTVCGRAADNWSRVDTASRILVYDYCGTGPYTLGVVILDPLTGRPDAAQQSFKLPAANFDSAPAGADGVTFWGGNAPSAYVNALNGAVVALDDAHFPSSGTDPRGEFLVEHSDGSYLYGPDGDKRCRITTDVLNRDNTAWLGGQFVTLTTKQLGTTDYRDFLTALDRTDCHPLTEVPVAGADGMFGAPGVTIVISRNDTGTFVDGYL